MSLIGDKIERLSIVYDVSTSLRRRAHLFVKMVMLARQEEKDILKDCDDEFLETLIKEAEIAADTGIPSRISKLSRLVDKLYAELIRECIEKKIITEWRQPVEVIRGDGLKVDEL